MGWSFEFWIREGVGLKNLQSFQGYVDFVFLDNFFVRLIIFLTRFFWRKRMILFLCLMSFTFTYFLLEISCFVVRISHELWNHQGQIVVDFLFGGSYYTGEFDGEKKEKSLFVLLRLDCFFIDSSTQVLQMCFRTFL